jgi:uncharacterized membrane protein YeaQ/YmgE (transglycosylase-associated protein family)
MMDALVVSMDLLPFLIIGLVNGVVVGVAAGLVVRAIAPGDESMRFRTTALLGMVGALAGSVVATAIDAHGSGPSSLLFSFSGAMLANGLAAFLNWSTIGAALTRS